MDIKKCSELVNRLINNIEKYIKGKREQIILLIVGLLAKSHVLIEDIPGIGKTSLALALAKSIDAEFSRIQMTADMLPSDIVGGLIFNPKNEEFEVRLGPIYSNIVLCDELNRATPKTQSALLQCMAEGSITIDKYTYNLKSPFMVIATQNPLDVDGCYKLGESQKDRFLLSFKMGYPDYVIEKEILKQYNDIKINSNEIIPVLSINDVLYLQSEVLNVLISDEIIDYILKIINVTRKLSNVYMGISTRGAIMLKLASLAYALILGREYVIYDDVKFLAPYVLSHRIELKENYSSNLSAKDIIDECIHSISIN